MIKTIRNLDIFGIACNVTISIEWAVFTEYWPKLSKTVGPGEEREGIFVTIVSNTPPLIIGTGATIKHPDDIKNDRDGIRTASERALRDFFEKAFIHRMDEPSVGESIGAFLFKARGFRPIARYITHEAMPLMYYAHEKE